MAVDPVEMHELVGVRFAHQPRCLGPCDLTGVVRFVEAGGADGHDDVAQRLDPFERSLVENAHQPHVVDAGAADDVVRAVVGGDDVAVASQCGVGRGDDVAVMPSRRVVEFRLDEGVESVAGALGQILFERGDALYFSVRKGERKGMYSGRYYCDYDRDSLDDLLDSFDNIEIIDIWKTSDARGDEQSKWYNVLLRKISKEKE